MKKFSIDDVQMYRENDEDMDFAEVEIWGLASGGNSHHNPFSLEVLKKDADSFRGKFLIGKYDEWAKDTTTHVPKQSILGYVDPNAEIEFKEKEVDGEIRTYVVVKGKLSKVYATEVVDIFRKDNGRTVSCEFSCATQYEEDDDGTPIDEFGQKMYGVDNPVLSYHIHGITILGLRYNPSVPETEIKVKKFAEEFNKDSLRKFAEERKEKLNIKSNKKDFNINSNNDNKEDKMEDKKEFESKVDDKEKDIVMEEKDEKEDKSTEQPQEEEAKKEMADEAKEDKAETEEKEMGCGKEMSDDEEDKDKEEKKEFSLKDFVDEESLEDKEMAEKLYSMSANDIVKEMARLKAFEDDRLAKDKEIKLSQIMASVKEDLETKTFSELQEEGAKLSLDELGGFENKVKAFAYEQSKGKEHKEDDGIMRFASNETIETKSELTTDEIYKKYL